MKKRTGTPHAYNSPPVSLSREDLEEMLEILKANCHQVTIEDEEYEYESLDELKDRRGATIKDKLVFRGKYAPLIDIIFIGRMWGPQLVANGEQALTPFHQIKSILEKRKKRLTSRIFSAPVIISFLILLIFPLSLSTSVLPKWVGFIYFVLMMVVLFKLNVYINRGFLNTISLDKRHEQNSFWTRNKDAIWLAIITAIITAFISILVSYLLFRNGINKPSG